MNLVAADVRRLILFRAEGSWSLLTSAATRFMSPNACAINRWFDNSKSRLVTLQSPPRAFRDLAEVNGDALRFFRHAKFVNDFLLFSNQYEKPLYLKIRTFGSAPRKSLTSSFE